MANDAGSADDSSQTGSWEAVTVHGMTSHERGVWRAAAREDRARAAALAKHGQEASGGQMRELITIFAKREIRQRWMMFLFVAMAYLGAVLLRPWSFRNYFIVIVATLLVMGLPGSYRRLRTAVELNAPEHEPEG